MGAGGPRGRWPRNSSAPIRYPETLTAAPAVEIRAEYRPPSARHAVRCSRFNRLGIERTQLALRAAGCLLQYAKDAAHIVAAHPRRHLRALELTQNLSAAAENMLADVLDRTVTPMGSRMLKRWLHMPPARSLPSR
ncbi:MAG: DNA mismatch repair protein MutS [Sodalis sp.]|nr:MAG: DNA mismatch repair protein MutS [Sodalis sp.]